MDLLRTLTTACSLPNTRPDIDGRDLTELLFSDEDEPSPHDIFYYYNADALEAVRWRNWKLRIISGELFDLDTDVAETRDVSNKHPDIMRQIRQTAESARALLGDELEGREGTATRPPGRVKDPVTLTEYVDQDIVDAMYDWQRAVRLDHWDQLVCAMPIIREFATLNVRGHRSAGGRGYGDELRGASNNSSPMVESFDQNVKLRDRASQTPPPTKRTSPGVNQVELHPGFPKDELRDRALTWTWLARDPRRVAHRGARSADRSRRHVRLRKPSSNVRGSRGIAHRTPRADISETHLTMARYRRMQRHRYAGRTCPT